MNTDDFAHVILEIRDHLVVASRYGSIRDPIDLSHIDASIALAEFALARLKATSGATMAD